MENLEKKTEKLTFEEKIAVGALGIYALVTFAIGGYLISDISKIPEHRFSAETSKIARYAFPTQYFALGAVFTGLSYFGFIYERKNKLK